MAKMAIWPNYGHMAISLYANRVADMGVVGESNTIVIVI